MRSLTSVLLPVAFLFAGMVCRIMLQHFESRFQIAGFLILAAAMPFASRQAGWPTAGLCAAAATAGILIVKFAIEGWPI
ncbi:MULTISPECIES: hypothetical protein [unclassified Sphingomonas]|uniref:hypothetical protein n=2 Tax=Sphingomonas TaxID=13687 RepID=UPI00226AAA97|nr:MULTISPECIES: hypothetical protein [unclassified Sphingomonas]